MTGKNMARRDALKALGAGAMGLGASYGVTPDVLARFRRRLQEGQYEYRFFRAPELETIRVLADMIIPRDDVSGSATDAGTVEYMDFVLYESGVGNQLAWHDGLAWLDEECGRRFGGRRFIACSDGERAEVIDEVAWPREAAPEREEQVGWFNRVRDLVASGFFSSEMGVRDLGYMGGVPRPEWNGAPREALEQLGVSYDEWDARYGGRE